MSHKLFGLGNLKNELGNREAHLIYDNVLRFGGTPEENFVSVRDVDLTYSAGAFQTESQSCASPEAVIRIRQAT
jgi:hypothetical protein